MQYLQLNNSNLTLGSGKVSEAPSRDLTLDVTGDLTLFGVIILLTLALFNLWIIITNSLLLVGLWQKGSNTGRYPTDCYLINLTIVDICIGFLVLPLMTMVVVLRQFPFGASLCAAWIYSDYFLIVVSSYSYAALFINHFIMVRAPGKYRDTLQTHVLTIGVLWIAANLSWGPSFMHNLAGETNSTVCGYKMDKSSYYTMYVGITGFYIPFLFSVLCLLYSFSLLRKKSHNRLFYNTGSQFISRNGTVNTKQRNWSLAIIMETNQILLTQNQARKEQPLLLGLFGSFCLSRIPFYLYFGVGAFFVRVFPPDMSDTVYWWIHSNSAICPILHLVFDSDLRDAMRTFYCCGFCKKNKKTRPFASSVSLTVSTCSEIRMDSDQISY